VKENGAVTQIEQATAPAREPQRTASGGRLLLPPPPLLLLLLLLFQLLPCPASCPPADSQRLLVVLDRVVVERSAHEARDPPKAYESAARAPRVNL